MVSGASAMSGSTTQTNIKVVWIIEQAYAFMYNEKWGAERMIGI